MKYWIVLALSICAFGTPLAPNVANYAYPPGLSGFTPAQIITTACASGSGFNCDSTGTGKLVRQTSPTLTTPNIGAATGTTLTLSSNLEVSSTIRATGASNPVSGAGTEVEYTGGQGYVLSYDRGGGVGMPLNLWGSTVNLGRIGLTDLKVNSDGSVTLTSLASAASKFVCALADGTLSVGATTCVGL